MTYSVIIPAYNEEALLGECLEHIAKNHTASGEPFHEIIVVDNCSTDQTAAIAYAHLGVTVVPEAQKGIMYARQRGFLSSTGDIIAYVDADTRMPADWLARVEAIFAARKDVVCVSGPYSYYDLGNAENLFVWCMFALSRIFYLLFGHVVIGGNFAIRRETLEKMHGMDLNIAFYGDDSNIGRRARQFGKVAFDPKLVMPTSGRRLSSQGVVLTYAMYAASYMTEVLLRVPLFRGYKDYR